MLSSQPTEREARRLAQDANEEIDRLKRKIRMHEAENRTVAKLYDVAQQVGTTVSDTAAYLVHVKARLRGSGPSNFWEPLLAALDEHKEQAKTIAGLTTQLANTRDVVTNLQDALYAKEADLRKAQKALTSDDPGAKDLAEYLDAEYGTSCFTAKKCLEDLKKSAVAAGASHGGYFGNTMARLEDNSERAAALREALREIQATAEKAL